MAFCKQCGKEIQDNFNNCPYCGASIKVVQNTVSTGKSKIVAGMFGLAFGGFGIHNFYLGYTSRGIIQIFVTLFTCGLGSLWGFAAGILILAGEINTDSNGNPLVD